LNEAANSFPIRLGAFVSSPRWVDVNSGTVRSPAELQYGSGLAAYGLVFLAGHFVELLLNVPLSRRGYWQELSESIISHDQVCVCRLLLLVQHHSKGTVGVAHYLFGRIVTTWAFFFARLGAMSSSSSLPVYSLRRTRPPPWLGNSFGRGSFRMLKNRVPESTVGLLKTSPTIYSFAARVSANRVVN
jgi:Photosystem I psaA/psaB protein